MGTNHKKLKKWSTSSIFLNRMHTVYKYAIGSKRMIKILVRYYNIIIYQKYYPKRWLKILEVIIEKGKGPKLGKLRAIQLIKVDLQIIMRIGINTQNRE